MIFYNNGHKNFYHSSLEKCSIRDTNHKVLFYAVGIDKDYRSHINDFYDFHSNQIKINGLDHAWHTSGLYQSTLLVFNLFNDCVNKNNSKENTPNELFSSEYGAFFIEAVKLRYPEHTKVKNNNFMEKLR